MDCVGFRARNHLCFAYQADREVSDTIFGPNPAVSVISIFTWLFVVAGLLAGFEYWYVAGRHAGRERG